MRAKREKAAGSSGITGAPLPRPGRLDNTGMPLSVESHDLIMFAVAMVWLHTCSNII